MSPFFSENTKNPVYYSDLRTPDAGTRLPMHSFNENNERRPYLTKGSGVYFGIMFFAGCLLPLMIFLYITDRMMAEKNLRLIENQLVLVSNMAKTRLLDYVQHQLSNLTKFSVMAEKAGIIFQPGQKERTNGNRKQYLLKTLAAYFDFNELVFMDNAGAVLMTLSEIEGKGDAHDIHVPEKKLFLKNVAESMQGTLFSIMNDVRTDAPEKENTGLYLSMVSKDNKGMKTGIISQRINSSTIRSMISVQPAGHLETETFLIDNSFRILCGDPGKEAFPDLSAISPYHDNRIMTYQRHGKTYSIMLEKIGDSMISARNWSILTRTSHLNHAQRHLGFTPRSWGFIGITTGILMVLWIVTRQTLILPIIRYQTWAQMAVLGHTDIDERPAGRSAIDAIGQAVFDLSKRIETIIRYSTALSMGNTGRLFPILSENDALGRALNGIHDFLYRISLKIGSIGKGIAYTDDKLDAGLDGIGSKLNDIADMMNKKNQDYLRQIASAYIQAELIRQITGDLDLKTVCERILAFLCSYFKAGTGVFLVKDSGSDFFCYSGSYGCLKIDSSRTVRPGEGISGQAIKDKTFRKANTSDGSMLNLRSGLVTASPGTVLSYPFIFHDKVIAVMELAFANEMKADLIDFLAVNSESIATAIHAAVNRELTEKLLAKTIEQSRRMTEDQEKLKKANTELEGQTIALKQSEHQLRSREEDLKQANRELEAHSHNLDRQRQILDQKNRELEETKMLLENKAVELTRSNSYKSEFLANMSHELRTPLNSIILLSGILAEEGYSNVERSQKFARMINKSGKDLLNIIEEVLDLTRVSTGKMALNINKCRIMDLARIMKKVYEPVAVEKNIDFSITVMEGLPESIETDSAKLERLLKNIMTNAFKYTNKGHVLLDIGRPDSEVSLTKSGLDPEKAILFSITDTGEGIPESMKTAVFDAFKQVDGSTSRRHGGVGLGLSIANEFAGLLKGEIQLKSELGKGSCFQLYLPEVWTESIAVFR